MHNPLSFVLSLLLVVPVLGQQMPDEVPREATELPFLQSGAKELDAFATLAFKNEFPRRARDVWLEVLAEYDADDGVAREALGYVQVGTAWQPKPDFQYPKAEANNVGVAKMLEGRWEGMAKRLADGHRTLAEQLQAAGKAGRARYHLQRALRFEPADSKAQVGLGAKTIEGVTGTELELELLRRSRLLDRLLTKLTDQAFPVEPTDAKDERLDKGGLPYTAVKSEHFTVFGDWEPEVLQDAAQWAERSLAFCQDAFAGYKPWEKPPEVTAKFGLYKQKANWAEVVRKNASSIDDVEFTVKYTSATAIGRGKTGIYLGGMENRDTVMDFAVRKVAQEYARVGAPALSEGIGHAIVGMFFGRNLLVMVAQEDRQGTAAGKDYSKFDLPDLESWKDLARELAFERATAPAAHLPLIKASHFSHEERLKAWSFCDYLLRRDPVLLLELDRTLGKSKNDFDVLAAFQEATKLSLRAIEDDWRVFYTGDSAALQAIRNKVTPMQAVSKDAPSWFDELNRLRGIYGAKATVWSADLSGPCRQHADYLRLNKGERGPGKENTQTPGKPGFSNTGRLFAVDAVISTRDKDPRKAMEQWWLMPGYRDVLLDRSLETVGAYADGMIAVFDVTRGRRTSGKIDTLIFPFNDTKDQANKHFHKDPIPSAIDVDLLGDEARAVLQKHKLGKAKQVGFPLTAHFFSTDRNDVKCDLLLGGKDKVDGALIHSTAGTRRFCAPGLWVFLPLQPLKKGGEFTVIWTFGDRSETCTFTTS